MYAASPWLALVCRYLPPQLVACFAVLALCVLGIRDYREAQRVRRRRRLSRDRDASASHRNTRRL
jgi:hypothetical protein